MLNELEVLQIEFATRISRDRKHDVFWRSEGDVIMLCLLNVERIGTVPNFMSKKVEQLCVSDEEL